VRELSQNTIVKATPSQSLLSLNIRNINRLFPGFAVGDFAILTGSPSVLSLTSLLCVRAQLPVQLGGLGSNVIFIDGGNTFRLYQIARLARLYQLDPKQTLERIYISRAFTAYQMTALILEKLEETIKQYDAKLAIISEIAGYFLDKDVPDSEARRVYSQVTAYLHNFAKENQIILIATYPPHRETRRNNFLHALTCGRANSVISLRQTKYDRELVLEKHPRYMPSVAEFPSENPTLTEFIEA
jgi:predicted ATP-dependent serine protease